MGDSPEDSVDNSISITKHKIIFVGDARVGKTSIINRIADNPFSETYEMTIVVPDKLDYLVHVKKFKI